MPEAPLREEEIFALRMQFPMLHPPTHGTPFVYLDTAATAHKPRSVIDGIESFYGRLYATVHRSVYNVATEATSSYERVRQRIRTFLNAASADEIVFTKSTTEAINLVARAYGSVALTPGDEVLITTMEHHSNIIPWQWICRERGATLKVIPIDDSGELLIDAFDELLTKRTKIVSLAHIANATGTLNPIEYIIRAAHEKGAVVLIDGAQSASHLPVDVQALDCDFYAFSGHKAYGPTGIGVLYGKFSLLEAMPPYQGGGDMIEEVDLYDATFQPPPLKFEAGTPPIAQVVALGEAIHFIESIGRQRIAAWEQRLLDYATRELKKIPGLRILGTAKHKGALISFYFDDAHALDVATFLDAKGIAVRSGHMCAQPTLKHFGLSSVLRISFGVYNTFEDIDRCIQGLHQALSMLRSSLYRI